MLKVREVWGKDSQDSWGGSQVSFKAKKWGKEKFADAARGMFTMKQN